MTSALIVYAEKDAERASEVAPRLMEDGVQVDHLVLGRSSTDDRELSRLINVHPVIVHLITNEFLRSFNSMVQILPIMQNGQLTRMYLERTVPILIDDPDRGQALSDLENQLEIIEFWLDSGRNLEKQARESSEPQKANVDLLVARKVAEYVLDFMRLVSNHVYATPLDGTPQALDAVARRLSLVGGAESTITSRDADPGSQTHQPSSNRESLQALHDGILVPSEDDPLNPEFPPFAPRFPATPTVPLYVKEISRSVSVKDESRNPTGSHKDRMAWEIVVHYKELLSNALEPSSSQSDIKRPSIISNGSAAFAIQVMLRSFGLPDLSVLIDHNTDIRIVNKLRRAGCHVVIHDLSSRELHANDVLELTDNQGGLDFTSRDLVDPLRSKYYDWLAYEILNQDAKHIFIPVGTGDLFVNVLTVLDEELSGRRKDRRLEGGEQALEGVHLYGATSSDRKTRMDKLWAAYRPTLDDAKKLCSEVVKVGNVGKGSEIYDVEERFVAGALSNARAGDLQCDESGIAGLALFLQLRESGFTEDENVLIVNTGWLAVP